MPSSPAPTASAALNLRTATRSDLQQLVELELRSFDSDRISRRSFRRFITSGRDILLVVSGGAALYGYVLVLMRKGTALGRIYSICVDPAQRGRGIARDLMLAAEDAAKSNGCARLRLEVKDTNTGAIALYRQLGFRKFGAISHYYEDDGNALRFEKRIRHFDSHLAPVEVPFYAQSTRFTCGPASLLMAMRALDPGISLDEQEELRLWRESTTIFMTSGHGGCGPHGLALAASRRGFNVELWLNSTETLFKDGVRSPEKRRVLDLVQADYTEQLADRGITAGQRVAEITDLQQLLAQKRIPVTLISSWALRGEKAPHWIVVAGVDDHFVYIHDPDVDDDERAIDCQYIPVEHDAFMRMSRFGKANLRSLVIVG